MVNATESLGSSVEQIELLDGIEEIQDPDSCKLFEKAVTFNGKLFESSQEYGMKINTIIE